MCFKNLVEDFVVSDGTDLRNDDSVFLQIAKYEKVSFCLRSLKPRCY